MMRMNIWRLALTTTVIGVAAGAAMCLPADGESDDQYNGTFQGKWVNRKMKSSGPLRCQLRQYGEKDWSAVFDGKFKGEGFKYDVKFDGKKSAAKTDFKGTASIDGDQYEWTGTLKGESLSVKYRSQKGYNGEFQLKKDKAGKSSKKKPK